MRNKKAKLLRKVAKQVGKEDLKLERKMIINKKDAKRISFQHIWAEHSVRSIYKKLKRSI